MCVSQPSSGLDKRQATLQLCIGADGEQNVKPALIFGGKGRVATEEKEKYDTRVDVYFQQNAWMDEEIYLQWVQGILISGSWNDKEKIFYFQTMSAATKVNNFMKHREIKSTLQFTCCLKTTLTKSSPLMQDVVG